MAFLAFFRLLGNLGYAIAWSRLFQRMTAMKKLTTALAVDDVVRKVVGFMLELLNGSHMLLEPGGIL